MKYCHIWWVIVAFCIAQSAAIAGGIGVGATRVIYNADARQVSLSVNNTDDHDAFLIQSWIEDEQSNKNNDFIITPPLFVIEPLNENILKIIFSEKTLPQDRESLYWINIKAIPGLQKNKSPDISTLQIAVVNKLKLIYRPRGLRPEPHQAASHLNVKKKPDGLFFDNPTPYYMNVVNIRRASHSSVQNMVVKPFSTALLPVSDLSGEWSYQIINDYGALSSVRQVK